jgi:CRP-like cAMP-binding protein
METGFLGKAYMETDFLGKAYKDGDTIIKEGDEGDFIYVLVSGKAEVLQQRGSKEVRFKVLEPGDFFGEIALFEDKSRSATVRALGHVCLLTIDKNTLLRRIQENPSLAFNIVQVMCSRIRELVAEQSRRMVPRVPKYIPLDLNFKDKRHKGYMLDLSEAGTLIYSSTFLNPGDILHLKFSLPDEDKMIDVDGKVVWANKFSTGINFTRISPEHEGHISAFVKKEMERLLGA